MAPPLVKIANLLSFGSDEPSAAFGGLDLLATAVLLLAPDHAIVFANAAAENLFELSKRKIVGRRPDELFVDAEKLLAAFAKTRAGRASYTEQELELAIPGKTRLHLACTVSPVDVGGAALLVELRHIDQQLKIARE